MLASKARALLPLFLLGAPSCTPSPVARDAPASPSSVSPPAAAPSDSSVAQPLEASTSGLANPASVHCQKHGGTLEIVTEPAGEVGVCVFADGSRCCEWDFYRGRCSAGSCRDKTGKCSP